MKKIALMFSMLLVLTGCSLGKDMLNTPTHKVEEFFTKYQTLDQAVIDDLDNLVKEEVDFNNEQRDKYREIFKKHYKNLKYDIKNEKIDGDNATVEVEIEVSDYSRALAKAEAYMNDNPNEFLDENGEYDNSKFIDYQLEQLDNVKETIIYTLSLNLTKQKDEWKLEPLTSIQQEKINGIYVY